jgi:hypothetical protein
MGSEKSPLNSSDSSWAKAFLAMTNIIIVSKLTKKWEVLAEFHLRMLARH